MIAFFATGIPKGQPRPRAFSRGGMARVYDPGTAEGWKGDVALAARKHLPATPILAPVMLKLRFVMPRPRTHFRTGKNRHLLRDGAPGHYCGKPDCDNLAKAVMDAMTLLGFWRDDAQIVRLVVTKEYGEPTGCDIIVEPVEVGTLAVA